MLTTGRCPSNMLSIRDALEALEGKWKLLILFSLSSGPKRFKQISKEVNGGAIAYQGSGDQSIQELLDSLSTSRG